MSLSTLNMQRLSTKSTASLQNVVLREIGNVLDIPHSSIDLNAGFLELGGHSLSAIELVSACKSREINVSVEDILLGDTIGGILNSADWIIPKPLQKAFTLSSPTNNAHHMKRSADSAFLLPPSKKQFGCHYQNMPLTPPCDEVQTSMTEMQQIFVQGSKANPGTNVISFIETYATRDVPVMKHAWLSVLQAEAIFRTRFEFTLNDALLLEQTHSQIPWDEVTVSNQDEYDLALEVTTPSGEVATSFKIVSWASHCQNAGASTIIWRVHHALIDGFSAALLYRKVKLAAAGLPTAAGTSFTTLARGLQTLQDEKSSSAQDFWKKRQDVSSRATGDILLPKPANSTSTLR